MRKTSGALSWAALIVVGAIWMLPFVAAVREAVRPLPGARCVAAGGSVEFARAAGITLLVSLTAAAVASVTGAAAGYALSKKDFYGRKLINALLIGSVFFPPVVMMAPLFHVTARLGLYNSLLGLVLASSASGLAVVFMKAALDRLPTGIIDAARLDGLGEWAIFTRIVLPLARRPLAAVFLLQFALAWGALALPLAVIDNPRLATLSMHLAAAVHRVDPPPRAEILWMVGLLAVPPALLFSLKARDIIAGVLSALLPYERLDEPTL